VNLKIFKFVNISKLKKRWKEQRISPNRHPITKTKKLKMSELLIFKLLNVIIFVTLAVADCIRTSLGPRGMDKMIKDSRG